MKKIIITAIVVTLFAASPATYAQQINWRSVRMDQKYMFNLHAGMDYGTSIGGGFAYKPFKRLPLFAGIEQTFSTGETMLDDFKTKMGASWEALHVGKFSATVKAKGVFRRHENVSARYLNFGSELSAVLAYAKTKWYAGAELMFDKAITTQVKHSKWSREIYPGIQDGWYLPTGGNFSYGIQGGFSFWKTDLTLRAGRMIEQDLATTPTFPYYMQVGVNVRM